MKPLVLIAGMALFGGIGGAAYSEYDRLNSAHEQIRNYILHNAKAYKADKDGFERAVEEGVAICAARIYQVEVPPAHRRFFALNIATDYDIVNRYGLQANEKQEEIADIRAHVGSSFYTALPDELKTLPAETKERLTALSIDFRDKREKLAHCTHANTYKIWFAEKPAES